MKKRVSIMIAILLCVCMIAGCSSAGSSTSPETNSPVVETTDTVEPDADSDSSSDTVEGEYSDDYYTVTMTASFPLYTDPATATSAIEYIAIANLYDPLVMISLEGEATPHVAESWEISDDGMTYTFHIRNDIKFHDGTDLNADDVVYSMERLLTMGQGLSYLFSDYVDSVQKVDDYTVQFNMKKTYGPFLQALGVFYILNQEAVEANYEDGFYGEQGDYGANYLTINDAGSGPYKIKEYVMGENFLAEKFDDWYMGFEENVPKYFHIIPAVDTVTLKTLMENRTLTILDEWQSPTTVHELDDVDGIGVAALNIGSMASIEMNTRIEPTDDVHFRKAMQYLFNYETATTQIYPEGSIPYGPVSSVYAGALDQVPMEFNIEKAKEELAKSKYADQLGNLNCDLYWLSDVPDGEKLALLMKSACEEVGVNINIVKTTYMNSIELATAIETSPNMSISYPAASYPDASAVFLMRYHSSNSGTSNQFEWLQDPEIDAAIDDAIGTVNDDERYAKYQAIQQSIIDLAPTVWMYESPELRAYQEEYLDWEAADMAKEGKFNCAVIGRYVYLPEMKIYPEKRAALLGK